MRLPLATSIESRDGTLNKDAKLVNCFVNVHDDTAFVVKRPGLRPAVATAAGDGLGMVSWEGNLYHGVGATIYQTSYASIPIPGVVAEPVGDIAYHGTSYYLSGDINAYYTAGGYIYIYVHQIGDDPVLFRSVNGLDGIGNWTAAPGFNLSLGGGYPPPRIGATYYWEGLIVGQENMSIIQSSDGAVWSAISGASAIDADYSKKSVFLAGSISTGSLLVYRNTNAVYGAVGIYTSNNGVDWTLVLDLTAADTFTRNLLANIRYGNGKFYCLNPVTTHPNSQSLELGWCLAQSTDLVTWSYTNVTTELATSNRMSLHVDGDSLMVLEKAASSNNFNLRALLASGTPSISGILDTYGYGFTTTQSPPSKGFKFGSDYLVFDQYTGWKLQKISVTVSLSGSISPGASYAFTTATPGLPLSWVGTSPGAFTKRLFIKNAEKAWTLTLGSPGTLTEVSDADYPGATVPGAVYLDGYFFVMTAAGEIYNSALEDPTSWNALHFITAEAEWDRGVAVAKHQNYVLALKDWTCELFYDAGNPEGSPLARVQNATIQLGCAQGYSVVQFHGGLVFVSKTREKGRSVHLFPIGSIEPQEIATPAVQRVLNAADLSEVSAWGGKIAGCVLYVLNLVSADITLVYDFATKTWTQWTSDTAGTEGHFLYGFYATDGSREYLLHESAGTIDELTMDAYQDDGADIKVLARTGRIDGENLDRKTMRALTVVGDQAGTSVTVQFSDDDYQTLSAARSVSLANLPARLNRLGMFRRRSFDIRHVHNTPLRLVALDAEIEQAR